MEQTLAEKLKMENELISLKRELKNVTEQVKGLKTEYSAIASLKDNTEKQIEEQKEYLGSIHNDIASAKLDWIQEKSAELDKLAIKNSEADNVIKRKAELNEQEEAIRKIEKNNIDVLNETRRLELKLNEDKTALEVRAKEIEESKQEINEQIKAFEKLKKDFKGRIEKILKEADKF